MNGSEFETWIEDVKTRWPNSSTFFLNLPSATERIWFKEFFSRLSLEDCLAANGELMASDEVAVYDLQNLPVKILGIVKRRGRDRETEYRLSDPNTLEHWKRETYGCHLCRDTGHVTCWSSDTMQHAIWFRSGQISEEAYRRAKKRIAAPCTCELGENRTQLNAYRDNRLVKLRDVARFCPIRMVQVEFITQDGDTALLEWADEWNAKHNSGVDNPVYSNLIDAGLMEEAELVQTEAF